jgi:hypothetical protein
LVRKLIAFAVRSGVFTKPSRVGSSPNRVINSAYRSSEEYPLNPLPTGGLRTTAGCAMLSLSRIFEKIVPRLFHPHSFKISVNKVLREQVVNGYTKILCGGHLVREALIKI